MSDKELEAQLLAHVPLDGSTIGNISLLRRLGWDDAQYWRVRDRLVDGGVLELRRGRGGSVRRLALPAEGGSPAPAASASAPAASESDRESSRVPEAELYEPMKRVLSEQWLKDRRIENAIVHITAQQGSRSTGGAWSRPDITVATMSTYAYVPGRHFDVITFELKPYWNFDVTAVYEALGHRRSATRAYVLLYIPDEQKTVTTEDRLDEVCAEAKRHGVGVIVAGAPDDYDTWDELVEPVRAEPEPSRLNEFLAKQFTQQQLERLVKWFR